MVAALAAALLAGVAASTSSTVATSQVEVRRVEVSFSFAGRDVFLFGQVPAGTRRVGAVMEGPSAGPVRLMEMGRLMLFWLGVRQYRLEGIPGVYLVNLSCPFCNGLAVCQHEDALETSNRLLGTAGSRVGPAAVWAHARLTCLSGPLKGDETPRVLAGFWSLEQQHGLFGIRTNAIRISPSGAFYHNFALPAGAPEGRYRITTYFLSENELLAARDNEIVVRKTSIMFRLSRLAERNALWYGVLAVTSAVAAGWVAGTLFKRGGH